MEQMLEALPPSSTRRRLTRIWLCSILPLPDTPVHVDIHRVRLAALVRTVVRLVVVAGVIAACSTGVLDDVIRTDAARDAGHVRAAHHGTVARSARRPQGRTPGRRRGDLEHAEGLAHAVAARIRRHHQLRPRLLRHERHPGQLQRLPDLGHLESRRTPRLRVGKICPASQSDVSVYKNLLFVSAEAPTARLDCGTEAPREVGEPRPHPRPSHLRHHRHRQPEVHRQRADVPRLAHAHGRARSEGRRATSTSTSRARRAFVRPKSWRAATTTPGTRTTRTSASKSSRFRSRIRSRRRS